MTSNTMFDLQIKIKTSEIYSNHVILFLPFLTLPLVQLPSGSNHQPGIHRRFHDLPCLPSSTCRLDLINHTPLRESGLGPSLFPLGPVRGPIPKRQPPFRIRSFSLFVILW